MLQIGQTVRVINRRRLQEIAERLVEDGHVNWKYNHSYMFDFMAVDCGRKMVISDCHEPEDESDSAYYELEDSRWFWDEWMLEPLE